MSKVVEFLSNPSVRRLFVFLLAFLTTLLHRKLGIELDPGDIFNIVLVSLGYIGQSAVKEALVAGADAKVAIADALKPAPAAVPAVAPVAPPAVP